MHLFAKNVNAFIVCIQAVCTHDAISVAVCVMFVALNKKWNSSSSFKTNVHLLSLNGIAVGFCHLPGSIFNQCEAILK